jgi:hypothetical protein
MIDVECLVANGRMKVLPFLIFILSTIKEKLGSPKIFPYFFYTLISNL